MHEMRRLLLIAESVQFVNEITIGGGVDGSFLDDIKKTDFKSKQQDLFSDIPTLEPDLPKDFEEIGRIGSYFIARKKDGETKRKQPEYSYILFDKGMPFGYVSVIDKDSPFGDGYFVPTLPLDGVGLRVVSIFLDSAYRGQNIAIKMYEWLLKNVCDYILPDDLQTRGGVAIWRQLLKNRKIFDVMVYDYDRQIIRRRKAGKDFDQVYKNDNLRPFVTLAGKSNEIIDY